jgi:CRISPR-associated endonuclease/helicase Cas3
MTEPFKPFYRYWGKADKDGAAFHLLPYHCLDVAAVAELWLDKDDALRHAFARCARASEPAVRAWLLFFIAIHDFGKLDVRFQLKDKDLAIRLNPLFGQADHRQSRGFVHGDAGLAWYLKECGPFGFAGEAYYQAADWARAVMGHHGIIKDSATVGTPDAAPEVIAHDSEARRLWAGYLREKFLGQAGIGPEEPPPLINHSQRDFIAGFCSVCDWLGSNERYFPYETTPGVDLRAYYDSRLDYAEEALAKSGLLGSACAEGGMANIYPSYSALMGAQDVADKLPALPGLTLIEATTGSGKTEAALAHASRLIATGHADGIIFALPTQATANAMLGRIDKISCKLFPVGGNIVLAHGKARFNQLFERKDTAARKQPNGEDDAFTQCAHWLAESRKRVFLGQIGVCTVDQVLLSVLPLRHKFVRAFGLGRNVLIVDEVHACDSYMNGLLDRVLQAQRAVGGSAILLSATLPDKRRAELFRAWGVEGLEGEPAYPLVTRVDENGVAVHGVQPPPSTTVGLFLARTPDAMPDGRLVDEICRAVKDGAKVAMICNLVADAQRLARRLDGDLGENMDVFHSRYRFRDRQEVEAQVMKEYGAGSRHAKGKLVVATQVVEQSLDLDFDWMITQLCPADSLFQRLGRLHRRPENPRPAGFGSPRATVIAPEGEDFGLHGVLYNPATLWRTRKLIEGNGVAEFPGAYREWIKAVYSDEPMLDEPDTISTANKKYMDEQDAARFTALQILNSATSPYQDTHENVTYLTRDGEMSLNVVPVEYVDGKRMFLEGDRAINSLDEFELAEAMNMESVPVPHSWGCRGRGKRLLPEPQGDIYYLDMSPDGGGGWTASTEKARFVYTRAFGLEIEKEKP